MTSQIETSSLERINPLKRVSRQLFRHGLEHKAQAELQNSSFDRLVAGVHVDNALELFLKYHGAKHNIQGYKRKLVPELLTLLRPHIPELAQFAADLQTFHDIRDVAYHLGLALDGIDLSWGTDRVKTFCDEVEKRERQASLTLADGGSPRAMRKNSKAEAELETAIRLFRELPPNATKEQIETVLTHMFKAVEYWLDKRLEKIIEKEEISRLSLDRKIEILKKEISDRVLLSELRRIRKLRNAVIHSKEVRINLSEVYKYLQIVMHFVKVESPSRYGVRFEAQEAENKVRKILEEYGFAYRKNTSLEGYSRKTRFDFVIQEERLVIELRHGHARRLGRIPSIYLESLAFRIVDLKRMDKSWKSIVVLSGQWSKRSEEILKKYSDYAVKLEDFEQLVRDIQKS